VRHDPSPRSLISIACSHEEIARVVSSFLPRAQGQAGADPAGLARQQSESLHMSMWLGLLLGIYLLGIVTGIVGVAYVQAKARDSDGYNPWEPK
jgi:hypothetical protein